MSSTIKKVAVAGPNGNTGLAIVKALLASNFEVTALTRSISKTQQVLGSSIKIIQVDYLSHDSLVSALKDIDAVVVCGVGMIPEQTNLIDAAIAAGVQRFMPSSFDMDINTPARRALPFNERKIISSDYLKARESRISHSSIRTGPLLDFCLSRGALINMKDHSIMLFDGGEKRLSTTTTETAAKAVAAVLKIGHAAENREFWIHDTVVCQNELLRLGKEVLPDVEWKVEEVSTDELKRKAEEAMKVDRMSRMVDVMTKMLATFGKEFEGVFARVDNEELGLGTFGEEEVKEVLASFLGREESWQVEREGRDKKVIAEVTAGKEV